MAMANGPMRVAAYCDTDRYPYRTTVSNCWISSAWGEV